MPSTSGYNTRSGGAAPYRRNKRRINKLIGKELEDQPRTRSRLASGDFSESHSVSYLSDLKDIKKSKRSKLNSLKYNDMFAMAACDEDSALSVQNHIRRKYRKRKAMPLIHY